MPKAGDILFHKEWVFDDGEIAPKLLVILNTPVDIDTPYLVLKTTKNPKWYSGVKSGCNPDKKVFFVLKVDEPCFDIDTYIQLPNIREITTTDLLRGCFSKIIVPINAVSISCFQRLKNCLKNFKYDISLKHQKLIFG